MNCTRLDGSYTSYISLKVGDRIQLDWERSYCTLDREIRPEGYLVKQIDDLHFCILECLQSQIHGYMLLFNLENKRIDRVFTVEDNVLTSQLLIPSECVIYDISDQGERWEGSMDQAGFEGWGSVYDTQGYLEYEGFMFHGKKMGYGIQYHPELGIPYYIGTFVNGECIGFGTSYSREGAVIHQGLFPDIPNELVLTPEVSLICNQITSLTIGSLLETQALNLNLLPCLCQLRCTDKSLPNIRSIVAIDHHALREIILQDWSCCSEYTNGAVEGSFVLQNCEWLQTVEIGAYCLRKTRTVCIANCSSLITLLLGEFSFNNAEELVLRGIRSASLLGSRLPLLEQA